MPKRAYSGQKPLIDVYSNMAARHQDTMPQPPVRTYKPDKVNRTMASITRMIPSEIPIFCFINIVLGNCGYLLFMQAHHGYRTVFCEFPGLADVEIEQTMPLWENHDEVGVILPEVIQNPIPYIEGMNEMNFGI